MENTKNNRKNNKKLIAAMTGIIGASVLAASIAVFTVSASPINKVSDSSFAAASVTMAARAETKLTAQTAGETVKHPGESGFGYAAPEDETVNEMGKHPGESGYNYVDENGKHPGESGFGYDMT